MKQFLQIVSLLIILLGLIHIGFALAFEGGTGTLWFVGAGIAIVFAGLINLVALDSGTSFSFWIALLGNVVLLFLFCVAVSLLNEPQVYVGMAYSS